MARIKQYDEDTIGFHCPGCGYEHAIRANDAVNYTGPNWGWNGSLEFPTITPSILVLGSAPEHRCHSFVREGKIRFLDDCHHALKGQTVNLPDWE